MYLNLALIIQLWVRKNINLFSIVILIATILSTGSTVGAIVLYIVVSTFIVSRKKISTGIVITQVFLAIVIVLITVNDFYSRIIANKFSEDNYSFYVRIESAKTEMEIIKSFPLFGAGISRYTNEMSIRTYRKYGIVMGNSPNSFSSLSAMMGIPFVVILTFYYFSMFLGKNSNIPTIFRLSGALVALLVFSTQAMMLYPFWLSLTFLGISSNKI